MTETSDATIKMSICRFLALFVLSQVLSIDTVLGASYRCEHSNGITVLTDSPAQLGNCTLVLEDASPSSLHAIKVPSPSLNGEPSPTNIPNNDAESTSENSDEDLYADDPDAQDAEEENSGVVAVPVTAYRGSLVMTVRLNQTRDAQLILDTGATMTVLSTDVALELGLLADTNARITTVNTAGGPIQVNVTHISSIQAGEAKADNVVVAIHDLPEGPPGIDGLLGMSFLNNFLVTLDTNAGQLYLKSPQ